MFKTLEQIAPSDAVKVGGKALNCARLLQGGFPVPAGLVVPADAGDADLDRLLTHAWFATQSSSQRFAVRSSGVGEDGARQSFAGIHDTLLNVEREGVPDAVRACRRSVTSHLARAYRASHGLSGEARTGVLIQPMVDAIVSGVAFTVNPVTGADELLINAAPGLGDALVSGRVDPDEYRVRKADRSVLTTRRGGDRPPGGDRALDDDRMGELSALLIRIEEYFGAAQDVEWCQDGRRFWILQSRPVTTRAAEGVDIEWSRANLAEVFPEQMSPQAVSEYEEMLNRGQRQFMGGLLAPDTELGPPFKAFAGRLYLNVSQLRRLARLGGAPPSGVLRSLGHPDAIHPSDEVAVRPSIRSTIGHLPDLVRHLRLHVRVAALVRKQTAQNAAMIEEFARVDSRTLDDRRIWEQLETVRSAGPDRMQVVLLLGSVLFLEEILRRTVRGTGQSYEALVYPQLAAGEPSVSTQQAFDLVELADLARGEPYTAWYLIADTGGFGDFRAKLAGSRFLPAFERFLERYGHRGHYESDWALPRYREDPSPLLFAIRTHVRHPPAESRASIAARLDTEARAARAAFDASLAWWQRPTLAPLVRALVGRLKERYVLREHCRSDLTRVLFHARQWHLALADRFVERGWLDRRDDYFLIRREEIDAVVRGGADPSALRTIAEARVRELAAQRTLRMPLLMRQSEIEWILAGVSADRADTAVTDRLDGLCVSRGFIEAAVVVIRDPREFRSMMSGAILVARATDPSWTPLFTLAAGVIVEVGGMLSHASTVAREYGLPALANVKDATTRLRTGDRVRLHASDGYVDRLAS